MWRRYLLWGLVGAFFGALGGALLGAGIGAVRYMPLEGAAIAGPVLLTAGTLIVVCAILLFVDECARAARGDE